MIPDADVVPVLRYLRRHPAGDELLAYRDADGWTDVRASQINAYIRDTLGDGFSAKDFRTWRATVLAAVSIAAHDASEGRNAVTAVVRRSPRSSATRRRWRAAPTSTRACWTASSTKASPWSSATCPPHEVDLDRIEARCSRCSAVEDAGRLAA